MATPQRDFYRQSRRAKQVLLTVVSGVVYKKLIQKQLFFDHGVPEGKNADANGTQYATFNDDEDIPKFIFKVMDDGIPDQPTKKRFENGLKFYGIPPGYMNLYDDMLRDIRFREFGRLWDKINRFDTCSDTGNFGKYDDYVNDDPYHCPDSQDPQFKNQTVDNEMPTDDVSEAREANPHSPGYNVHGEEEMDQDKMVIDESVKGNKGVTKTAKTEEEKPLTFKETDAEEDDDDDDDDDEDDDDEEEGDDVVQKKNPPPNYNEETLSSPPHVFSEETLSQAVGSALGKR